MARQDNQGTERMFKKDVHKYPSVTGMQQLICPSALVIILDVHPDFSWFQCSCRVAEQFLRFDSGSHVASSGEYPRQETRYDLLLRLPLPSSW